MQTPHKHQESQHPAEGDQADLPPEPRAQSRALAPQVVTREVRVLGAEQDPMSIIEARNRAMERLLEYALRATRPEHWSDQGGVPYLNSAGAQAVARRCGVKVTNVAYTREEHQDEGGKFYEYVYSGTFSLPGAIDVLEGITGSCSSRDPLIGTNGLKKLQMEMDPGDIRKKAYTNLLQRGITQLLGIRGLEWSTLAQYGITPEGAAKIEYKAGAKGGGHGDSGGEFTFAFGKNKGKTPGELSDQDLKWYGDAFTRSLADPEKAKFRAGNEKGLAAVNEEVARRANKSAGAPAADQSKPTIWARIAAFAADRKVPTDPAVLGPIVKKATGKSNAKDLVEEDFAKCQAAIVTAADNGDDIPF
jgi:hypothetical protein